MSTFKDVYKNKEDDNQEVISIQEKDEQVIKTFKDFYEGGSTSIVVLTNKSEQKNDHLFITAQRIKEECKKAKIKCYFAFAEDAYIKFDKKENHFRIYNSDDKEGFELDKSRTAVIVRRSVSDSRYAMNLLSQLEEKVGLFTVNPRGCVDICNDKYQTIVKLQDANLPCPRSALVRDEDGIPIAVEKAGGQFPLILKTLHGSAGVGVFFAESPKSLKAVLQVVWKISGNTEILIQEFIKNDHDFRIHVLGDKIIAAMKRYVIKDDFRSNYSLGGKVENVDIEKMDEDLKEICIRASKAVGGKWTGVDLIIDEKTNKPYFLEVNTSAGTEGIEKVSKINVVGKVIEYINDRKHWSKQTRIAGFKEIITIIDKNGKKFDTIAKMGTGNSTHVIAIRPSDYEIIKNKVIMTIDGKKMEFEYTGKDTINVHGIKTYQKIERDTVKLKYEFLDEIYEVACSIDKQGQDQKSATILLNRKMMAQMNISVNPAIKYLLTVKPSGEGLKEYPKKDKELE